MNHAIRTTVVAAAGVAFFLATLLLPAPGDLGTAGWRTLGAGVLMGCLWISERLPFAATALLPLVVFPLAGVAPIREAAAPFASPVVFLFFGGILIAIAMERSNLHRRVALAIIRRSGSGRRAIIGGFMGASALLSMWVSNTAVAVMMLPIAVSVLGVLSLEDDRRFAPALLLAVAYGANAGGMATLVGTPPNAIFAGFVANTLGFEIGFLDWMILALPVSLLLLAAVWLVLAHMSGPGGIEGAEELVRREQQELGPPTTAEKRVALVFCATAILWLTGGPLSKLIPGLGDEVVAMAGGLSLFLIPSGKGGPLLDWSAVRRTPWDVLILIGGGLSLASAVGKNGVAEWIGSLVAAGGTIPAWVVLPAVVLTIIFLTEMTSNSATTSTFLPIAAALAAGFAMAPVSLGAAVAMASSCAFMLPVATPPNAIVFSSGKLPLATMMQTGFKLNIVAWIVISSWMVASAPWAANLLR
jgi:solute carrier family 13 (sodium-dependent dicarboxylate transporter), member 2/3/5